MQTLLANKDKIFEIKKKVEEKDMSLYNTIEIPNIQITDKTISIVMTASNRSIQTYFTLKTIQNSSFKEIHVIIVDDSDIDPITKEELEKYPFFIDFIVIKRENKNWVNPVVNYNIGFQYIKGSKVIIQNAEVCHIGDVLEYIATQITQDNYYVCDVKAAIVPRNKDKNSFIPNENIYKSNTKTIDIYKNYSLFGQWYQCREKLVNFHFLTAMTLSTFNKIKNFSYDYTMGLSFDDDDFLLKIIANKIKIKNLFHDEYFFGGIHLWHKSSIKHFVRKIESNYDIFKKKKDVMLRKGEYIDITENFDLFDEKYNIILNNNANITCK